MICAIPRASLRSVLFGIAPIADFACRVSMKIAAIPAAVSAWSSHAVSEQASHRGGRVHRYPLANSQQVEQMADRRQALLAHCSGSKSNAQATPGGDPPS